MAIAGAPGGSRSVTLSRLSSKSVSTASSGSASNGTNWLSSIFAVEVALSPKKSGRPTWVRSWAITNTGSPATRKVFSFGCQLSR